MRSQHGAGSILLWAESCSCAPGLYLDPFIFLSGALLLEMILRNKHWNPNWILGGATLNLDSVCQGCSRLSLSEELMTEGHCCPVPSFLKMASLSELHRTVTLWVSGFELPFLASVCHLFLLTCAEAFCSGSGHSGSEHNLYFSFLSSLWKE